MSADRDFFLVVGRSWVKALNTVLDARVQNEGANEGKGNEICATKIFG